MKQRLIALIFAGTVAGASALLPQVAAAQTQAPAPPFEPPAQPAQPPAPVPSYARPPVPSDEETIKGRIQAIQGKYDFTVNDDRGFIDQVRMHQGTIINPTGLTLAAGMSVTIMGYPNGNVFAANQIDTPYVYVPTYYPYWGPGPYWGWGGGPWYPTWGVGIAVGPRYGWGWGWGYGRWR